MLVLPFMDAMLLFMEKTLLFMDDLLVFMEAMLAFMDATTLCKTANLTEAAGRQRSEHKHRLRYQTPFDPQTPFYHTPLDQTPSHAFPSLVSLQGLSESLARCMKGADRGLSRSHPEKGRSLCSCVGLCLQLAHAEPHRGTLAWLPDECRYCLAR